MTCTLKARRRVATTVKPSADTSEGATLGDILGAALQRATRDDS
jgi:hypothetical protein